MGCDLSEHVIRRIDLLSGVCRLLVGLPDIAGIVGDSGGETLNEGSASSIIPQSWSSMLPGEHVRLISLAEFLRAPRDVNLLKFGCDEIRHGFRVAFVNLSLAPHLHALFQNACDSTGIGAAAGEREDNHRREERS